MTDPKDTWDWWRIPALLLWLAFFLIGLAPDHLFVWLRETGHVTTQNALANSPYLITISFAGYLAYFVLQRCLDTEISDGESAARALQTCIYALAAFLPLPLDTIFHAGEIADPSYRHVIYIAGVGKLFFWWYLWLLFVRYYGMGTENVFSSMLSLFPSSYFRKTEVAQENGKAQTTTDVTKD